MWGLPLGSPSMGDGWAVPTVALLPSAPLQWALRGNRDTGTVRAVLLSWEMGKQGEGGELSILFLCPPECLPTGFGPCVPFSQPPVPAVWGTGTCRGPPSPATPAPLFVGTASASLPPPAHGYNHAMPAAQSRAQRRMQNALMNKSRARGTRVGAAGRGRVM